MIDEQNAINKGAQTDKVPGASKEELTKIFAAALTAEINDINSRRRHSDNINPVVVGSARDIRWMRWGVAILAVVIPIVLLGLLLWHVYCYLPMFFGANLDYAQAKAIQALSTPLTALIIGTFASFIIVYSALLVGVFRRAPEGRNDKESQGVISSAAQQIAQNISGNGS